MTVWQAIALGLVQGATEFLPVSSDGHLALASFALGLVPSLAFDVLLHAGTLAVLVVGLRREVGAMVRGALRLVRAPRDPCADADLARRILVASVPTAVLGLLLRHTAEAQTASPRIVAAWLAVTGVLLLCTLARRGDRAIGIADALAIGVAQGLAVLPGLSRSGATIATALLFGVRRDDAARFSFAASIPAVAGALALELPDVDFARVGILPAAVGILAAAAAGALALRIVFAVVRGGRVWTFALYLFPLAAGVAALSFVQR